MVEAAPSWTIELQRLLAPRERIGGDAWAERERWIGADEGGPMTGQWRSIPWQREILDALADPAVQWLVVLKATQVGVSELVRNAIGRWAVHDPGDVLWVMATQDAAERSMLKLQRMFRNTPALRGLMSDRRADTKLLELALLNGMRVRIGWAGSAQSLASDPYPRVVCDETGLYRQIPGGSPSHLAEDRTKTFGRRRKVVLLSSPQEPDDAICTAHRETADRRVFAVPCPACGLMQPWEWERVRWPGGSTVEAPTDPDVRLALAERVKAEQSAWLACEAAGCAGRIEPRVAMRDPRAAWRQEVPARTSERRAYHVPEAWHWETTLSDLSAKFLRATSPKALGTFWTGSLGRVLVTAQTPIVPSMFEGRAIHAAGVVPSWATVVLSTADTQLGGWWLMVRAWAPDGRSRLLDWGWAATETELLERGLGLTRTTEGALVRRPRFHVEGGAGLAAPDALAIDTGGGMRLEGPDDADGSRTKQVYELVRRTPGTIALKGEGDRDGAPHRVRNIDGLELHLVNKTYYADVLAGLLRAAAPVLWEECRGAESPTYARQMSAEHRVLLTTASGARWAWQKKSAGMANHLWDCARYQAWLAEHVQVAEVVRPTWQKAATPAPAAPATSGGGWWDGRRDGGAWWT